MLFSEIIGLQRTKHRLLTIQDSGRAPHALLFTGRKGIGKLPLALAYAQRLCCQHPTPTDSCGECPSCRKFRTLQHPDLHLVFPFTRGSEKTAPPCSTLIQEFYEAFNANIYITPEMWSEIISNGKTTKIYDTEANEIVRRMNMKSYEDGYKVTLIYCPELMDEKGLNHILKVLEEPPANSCFLLVSDYPERIIATIMSRVQQVHVSPITDDEMDNYLQETYPELDEESRAYYVKNAYGSISQLRSKLNTNETEKEYLAFFKQLMRLSFRASDIKGIKDICSEFHNRKQAWTIGFLQYAQQQIRENFMTNLQQSNITYMNASEVDFSINFSQYIHKDNIYSIMQVLQIAQAQIEQNTNIQIVMFDVVLQLFYKLNTKQTF